MADDGFHEIQLSRKHLIFLFMSAAVVLVVAFLCGVLVGRGVRNQGALGTEAAVSLPAGEAVQEEPAAAGAGTPPPAGAPPVTEELSYQARLEGKAPAAESLKQPEPAVTVKPGVETPPAPPPAPAQPAAKAAAVPPEPGGDAGWLVQVAALRGRSNADAVAKRLVGKGYKAFVMAPGPKGSRMYRVVVGRFKSRPEAEEAKRRLEKEEQFKPWIIS